MRLRNALADLSRAFFSRALLCLALTAPVHGGEFGASASLASDYAYRGYTKSRGNPVLQGNLSYTANSGVYAGVWVSGVSFDDKPYRARSGGEIYPYLGWGKSWSDDWRTDLSVARYVFDDGIFGRGSDYDEFYGALHWRDRFTARIAFAHDAYNRSAKTFAYELTWRHRPWDRVQLSAGLGFNQAYELLHYDYFYWNAGLSVYLNRHVTLDVRYVDANLDVHAEHLDGEEDFYLRPLLRPVLVTLTVGF